NYSVKKQRKSIKQSITIKLYKAMTNDKNEYMVKDDEEKAKAEKQRREEIDLRNEADQLVFTTDKTIKDLGEKVTDEEKQKAEDAKEALKQALEGEDVEAIKEKKSAWEEEVHQ